MSKSGKIICGPPSNCVPAHLSFGRFLLDKFIGYGSKVALINGETGNKHKYSELVQWSVSAAVHLKGMGLKKGDVVAICSENRAEYLVTNMAVIFCGAAVAVVSMDYTKDEIRHALNLSKPKYIFCSSKALEVHFDTIKTLSFIERWFKFGNEKMTSVFMFNNLIRQNVDIEGFEPEEVDCEDNMAILCSSGTTGLPKGVILTHLNCLTAAVGVNVENMNGFGLFTMIHISPWHHSYGFMSLFIYLLAGRTLVFLTRFREATFLSAIQTYKVNAAFLVPTVVFLMTKSQLLDNYDLSSLKYIFSGAAVLKVDTILALRKRIPGLMAVIQGYGMTETTNATLRNDGTSDPGSVGKVAPGMKIKVVDLDSGHILGPNEVGEIRVKGPIIMKGYIGNSQATAEAFDDEGFLKTGDLGYYTDGLDFFIVDRVKDLIKYKGYQVAPAEVEEVLLQHPGVQECGVIGTADDLAGELPTAFVVKVPGVTVSEKELVDFVASKLSSPKKLRGGVKFINQIPKNPTGKILRRVLRDMYSPNAVSKL